MNRDESVEFESAIYQAALSIEETEARRRFLDRIYAPDDPAKAEMWDLIESTRTASRYFSEASDQKVRLVKEFAREQTESVADLPWDPSVETGAGMRLGGYRLIRRIGEGGSGIIYEAEQDRPVRRRVAVKVLRHGLDSREIIARFEAERQALAMMDHPGIAKILDASAPADRNPYFVMELVNGERITDHCDHQRLDIPARIELFIQVCHAIQHAHQKGIIHRDIKPSNILVVHREDGSHFPKIIDFGIAKATDARPLSSETVFTSHDQFFGTPQYASPEQLDPSSLDIDTRSDVYSLGVLLYELLTSMPPAAPADRGAAGISRFHEAILESDTVRPSERLRSGEQDDLPGIAARRRTEPASLIAAIRGDLDWIVLKAMEKARARRYQTVNSLAMDLERYLHDQPVLARPPGRIYLAGKFVRRNKLAVALSAVIMLLLLTALAVTTVLYRDAQRSRDLQVRLRTEAEDARADEERLRLEADARASMARVAFLLHQDRIDEADALYREHPPSTIGPSIEAAASFRSLANWHARAGRMKDALPCYRLLIQANRFEDPAKIMQGLDLIAIGAVLAELAPDEYRAYRSEVIDTYLPVERPVEAERLLKFCLLAPISAGEHQRLEGVAGLIGQISDETPAYWIALSTSLDHLRRGDFDEALAVASHGLEDEMIKRSCEASLRAVAAMAARGRGDVQAAAENLALARRMIVDAGGRDFEAGHEVPAYWFDWSVAKVLAREAGMPEVLAKP
ncbi:serine/threonine protein kinase [Luteolibacter marinus]|uniref:serine/threonine protein kinase n=1 Tax=Luteolibacter marinus TaxID=2776705 RepID=UPI001866152B|nr:serine/threonine-protein kinase [Luteolibacter marinus]